LAASLDSVSRHVCLSVLSEFEIDMLNASIQNEDD
jgi:hypothetical protein